MGPARNAPRPPLRLLGAPLHYARRVRRFGWLHLAALTCAWNGCKFICIGPVSITRLTATRLDEHRTRRLQASPDSASTPGSPE
jgi:hypothetical protein